MHIINNLTRIEFSNPHPWQDQIRDVLFENAIITQTKRALVGNCQKSIQLVQLY